jgi:glycine hydroxymethyltransferase
VRDSQSRRFLGDVEELIELHAKWRGAATLNLIASQNVMSSVVRNVLSSDLADRRTAGEIGRRMHSGSRYIDELELLALDQFRRAYAAEYVEYRALSCFQANLIAMYSLTGPSDTIMVTAGRFGGDISVRQEGPAGFRGMRVEELPFDPVTWNVDLGRFRTDARRLRPRLVIVGTSMPLFPYPLNEMRQVTDELGAILMLDGAHLLGPIASGLFPQPLATGAHLFTGSTQKTLGAPVGALTLTSDAGIFQKIQETTSRFVSSYHNPVAIATALAIAELEGPARDLGEHTVRNARALGGALQDLGFEMAGKERSYSQGQQVIIRFQQADERDDAFKRLEAANIFLTRTGAPDFPLLRVGVAEVTRYGMGEREMDTIASLVARAVLRRESSDPIARDVAALRSTFSELRYGFDQAAGERSRALV